MHEPKGEAHWKAKLCEDDVRLIRMLYHEGLSQGAIARKFEVGWNTVHDICIYKTWKHVR